MPRPQPSWTRIEHGRSKHGIPFVMTDEALRLVLQAETWHRRPSEMIGVSDPVVALALDDALLERLWQVRREQPADTTQLPAGLRYETARDIAPPPNDPARVQELRNEMLAKYGATDRGPH